MTLAASSQRSQIIRSKFRSGERLFPMASDSDPWISASGPALAPALPLVPASFLFSPGVLLPETEYCPWRSPKKPWSSLPLESKPRGNLTYHQYMPPEPRQGSRADPQVERSALGPQEPPLWEGTNSQQLHPRMKPTPLTPFQPGVPSPSPPPHKLELQTLKLEELTVSLGDNFPGVSFLSVGLTAAPKEIQESGSPVSSFGGFQVFPISFPKCPPHSRPAARWVGLRWWAWLRELPLRGPPPPPPPATALTPSSAPLTLEEELQEAIRRAQLLPNRGIDDILEDQIEPDDPLPPIPLDFPGSFDVLSPSPDSEGLSSVFSSSLPTPTNSPSTSPRGPTDSLDWLEALSGGPPLGSGPPAPSIFSADLSDSSGTRLWDLLEDPW
uniref:MEF2 activating motif and SAP domain containing transcriptional regulator n=1 Tax=Spermophilus dauricus TaxID=99837 RepID=A0A8C9P8S6_SPEDA